MTPISSTACWRPARTLEPSAAGAPPLVAAVKAGHAEVVELLLTHGAAIDGSDSLGQTALHWAAARGDEPLLRRLLAAGAAVDARNGEGQTALSNAVFNHHLGTARLLLAAGTDPDLADEDGTTPLMKAVRSRLPELVEVLLARRADPRPADRFGGTALSRLSWRDETIRDKIRQAFDRYQRPSAEMMTEWVRSGRLDRLRRALARGSDVDLCPALYLAAEMSGRRDALEALLDAGVTVDGSSVFRPLQAAAGSGRIAIVDLLLARGADVDARSSSLSTALVDAAGRGHLEMARRLLAAGAAVEPADGGPDPLDAACELGSVEVAELLLDAGATVAGPGRAPLAAAARRGHGAVVDLLLRRGADVEETDREGSTPLMSAAAGAHAAVVEALLAAGADAGASDAEGRTALDHADGVAEITALLAPDAAPPPPLPAIEIPPPVAAAYHRDREALAAALAAGAAADAVTSRGDTALMVAAAWGALDLVEALLAAGADPRHANRWGETPRILADTFGHTRVSDRLRAAGGPTDAGGVAAFIDRLEALARALRRPGRLRGLLADHRVDPNLPRPTRPSTPLTEAVNEASSAAVTPLLEAGALPDLRDSLERTALGLAARRDQPEIAGLLLAAGADPDRPLGAFTEPEEPPEEATGDHLQLFRQLFDAGPARRQRPLHEAAAAGSAGVLLRLVEAGADVHARLPSSATAAHEAAAAGHAEALEILRQAGADVDAPAIDGRPLRLAAGGGHERCVERLLAWGVAVDDRGGRDARTALHEAALAGHAGVVRKLVRAGAGVDVADAQGATPARLAELANFLEIARFLRGG